MQIKSRLRAATQIRVQRAVAAGRVQIPARVLSHAGMRPNYSEKEVNYVSAACVSKAENQQQQEE